MSDDASNSEADAPGHGQGATRRGFLTGTLALGGVTAGLGDSASVTGAEPGKEGLRVNPRLFTFVGGKVGEWNVISVKTIVGDPLPPAERVQIVSGSLPARPDGTAWLLRGVTSNARYLTRGEKDQLARVQAALGRPESTHAALIPIRKSAKWWDLTQDERRAIFEENSKHNALGIKYLPGVARRLHHCRDLSEAEPFDFLTLFDFTRADVAAFDDLVAALRATEEWKYVEREVDIRLVRAT